MLEKSLPTKWEKVMDIACFLIKLQYFEFNFRKQVKKKSQAKFSKKIEKNRGILSDWVREIAGSPVNVNNL